MVDLQFKLPEDFDIERLVQWSPSGDKYLVMVLREEFAEALGKALVAGKDRVVVETGLVDYRVSAPLLPMLWVASKIS